MTVGAQRDVNTGTVPCRAAPPPPPPLTLAFYDVDGQPLERRALDTCLAKGPDRLVGQASGLGAGPLHTEYARVRRLAQLAVALGVFSQGGRCALLVQEVIGDLEGEADPFAVVADRLQVKWLQAPDPSAQALIKSSTWPPTMPWGPAASESSATSTALSAADSPNPCASSATTQLARGTIAAAAMVARSVPNARWQVGRPRRQSSSSIQGRSSCTRE